MGTVAQHEKFLDAVHGEINHQYDVYMDSHVAMYYQQGDELIKRLKADKVPFFSSGTFGAGPRGQLPYTGIFLQSPNGQIYEFLALNQTLLPAKPSWDQIICNGTLPNQEMHMIV